MVNIIFELDSKQVIDDVYDVKSNRLEHGYIILPPSHNKRVIWSFNTLRKMYKWKRKK